MEQYIPKSALVAEINRLRKKNDTYDKPSHIADVCYKEILSFLNTLEVKEVDDQKERMSECPYRQVGCKMYDDKILECNGACSWVVDYPKLKELKAQKGGEV